MTMRAAALLLILAVAILHSEQNLVPPILKVLKEEGLIIGGERWEIYAGLLGTAPLVLGTLSSLAWGYLGDRYDRRVLFSVAILFGGVPGLATALADSYHELLIARTLTGIGVFGSYPLMHSLIADISPPQRRGLMFGLAGLSMGIGVLGGMLLAGIFARENWRLPFILVSVPNIIMAPVLLLALRGVKIGMGEPELAKIYGAGREYGYRIELGEFVRELLRNRTAILMMLQGIPGTLAWGIIPHWSVMFMIERWGLTEDRATLVVVFAGMGLIAGTVIGGLLADRLKGAGVSNARLYVSMIGIALGMIGVILLASYPHPYGATDLATMSRLFAIALIVFSFVSWPGPNVTAIMSEVSLPEHRGTLYSVFNVVDRAGYSLSPLVGSLMITTYKSMGYSAADSLYYTLITGSLFWLLCLLIWTAALRSYEPDQRRLRDTLRRRAGE